MVPLQCRCLKTADRCLSHTGAAEGSILCSESIPNTRGDAVGSITHVRGSGACSDVKPIGNMASHRVTTLDVSQPAQWHQTERQEKYLCACLNAEIPRTITARAAAAGVSRQSRLQVAADAGISRVAVNPASSRLRAQHRRCETTVCRAGRPRQPRAHPHRVGTLRRAGPRRAPVRTARGWCVHQCSASCVGRRLQCCRARGHTVPRRRADTRVIENHDLAADNRKNAEMPRVRVGSSGESPALSWRQPRVGAKRRHASNACRSDHQIPGSSPIDRS